MSDPEARSIASWHYEPPYSFYDWTADENDLAELLSGEARQGVYFSALGADDELVGFFGFKQEERRLRLGSVSGWISRVAGSGSRSSSRVSTSPAPRSARRVSPVRRGLQRAGDQGVRARGLRACARVR